MTNGEKIRAMTDEELALKIVRKDWNCPPGIGRRGGCPGFGCAKCWLNWLREEVTDG